MSAHTVSLTTALCAVAPLYLALVRYLRYQRRDAVHRHFSYLVNDAGIVGRKMTSAEAQRIISPFLHLELPLLSYYAASLALFKTYGIPTISKLLLSTGQLGSPKWVSKRYIDTDILISTWLVCPINGSFDALSPGLPVPAAEQPESRSADARPINQVPDPRANLAIARVNYLHGRYNISNNDMMYTIALFVGETIRWSSQWGWRPMTPLEQQALFVYWKDIGTRMGITDIPETRDGLLSWAQEYEEKSMVPASSNEAVADLTVEELLAAVPSSFGLKSFARQMVYGVLQPRVLRAMGKSPPPWYIYTLLSTILSLFKYGQRWLCLPRLNPSAAVDVNQKWTGLGTPLHPARYPSAPWYRPAHSAYSPQYWIDRLLVALGIFSAMPSESYSSQGYIIERQGPVGLENEGREEILRTADELLQFGCPLKH